MEFDKSRVYTSVNADELKVGSKVIPADSLHFLIKLVESDSTEEVLDEIEPDDANKRFVVSGVHWNLVYLISEPEEKKLKWTDLKVGDVITNGDESALVIHIKKNDNNHICAGDGWWYSDLELEKWEKVEK